MLVEPCIDANKRGSNGPCFPTGEGGLYIFVKSIGLALITLITPGKSLEVIHEKIWLGVITGSGLAEALLGVLDALVDVLVVAVDVGRRAAAVDTLGAVDCVEFCVVVVGGGFGVGSGAS